MSSVKQNSLEDIKPLEYQGRKASREKSEIRRRQILEAALRIIRLEGVRGVRHRAVAKEAQVPLAATTYYFNDIDEIIVDAFTLYTEKALLVLKDFTEHFYQPLAELLADEQMQGEQGAKKLIEFLTEHVVHYMQGQVVEQREMLIIEQAFRYEALVNEKVRILAKIHRKALYQMATDFYTRLVKSEHPGADAEILIGLFHTIEYNSLLNPEENLDTQKINSTLKHYISLLVYYSTSVKKIG